MNHTSLSRNDLIKSALSAIQDLDFIFTRLVDNPSEKQSNHLLPVVSRPLYHIQEVTMALDNLFMQQFNRKGRSNPGTFHPNSSASSHNFGAPPHNMFNPNHNPNMPNMHMPPPHMGNHNTFAPYMYMVPPPHANWSKENTPFDVKETPNVHKPILFKNITNLRSVIVAIDNIFNDDSGPKLTMIEHATHVNKLLRDIKFWKTSKPETNFNAPPFVVQCPADWSKTQTHVTKELHYHALRHLEAISQPDCASRLTPTDWARLEKAASNIDLMKKHEDMLRSILFCANDKDFIGNNMDCSSHRVYAFHRLINNFVFFNGNDEENFAFINSLVMKD